MAVTNKRIHQSLAYWCWSLTGEKWNLEKMCGVAAELGCKSIELVDPEDWPLLQQHNLVCALAFNGVPAPQFVKGFNNSRYFPQLESCMKQRIEECAAAKFPNVIAFTGYKWRDADDPASGEISLEEGADTCVDGLKQIVGHAERHGVNICLEMLNTRDDTHPMKGHPGYQGDDIDYVANIVRRVGSSRLKLLFDVYHVQVMNGDVIRRLDENKDILGHIHVAGNPGRGEIGADQEINYAAVMNKLLDVDYDGYVGLEFIPTKDPMEGLREAVATCDV